MPIIGSFGSVSIRGYRIFKRSIFEIKSGYFAGGFNNSTGLNSIEKYLFSNDSRSTIASTLSNGASSPTGMSDSGVAAYIGGIHPTSYSSTTNKMMFSTELVSTLATGLSGGRGYMAGISNSGIAGYFGGGTSDGYGSVATIDKFLFSNDSRTTLSPGLSASVFVPFGIDNTGSAGYFIGGRFAPNFTYSNTVTRVSFSTDVPTVISATLAAGRGQGTGASNDRISGYLVCGRTSAGRVGTVEKFVYNTETINSVSASLGAREYLAGASNSGVAGYFAGGSWGGALTTTDKLLYANETSIGAATAIVGARYGHAGFANNGAL